MSEHIPINVLYEISKNLSVKDLIRFWGTNKRFRRLYNNEYAWRTKLGDVFVETKPDDLTYIQWLMYLKNEGLILNGQDKFNIINNPYYMYSVDNQILYKIDRKSEIHDKYLTNKLNFLVVYGIPVNYYSIIRHTMSNNDTTLLQYVINIIGAKNIDTEYIRVSLTGKKLDIYYLFLKNGISPIYEHKLYYYIIIGDLKSYLESYETIDEYQINLALSYERYDFLKIMIKDYNEITHSDENLYNMMRYINGDIDDICNIDFMDLLQSYKYDTYKPYLSGETLLLLYNKLDEQHKKDFYRKIKLYLREFLDRKCYNFLENIKLHHDDTIKFNGYYDYYTEEPKMSLLEIKTVLKDNGYDTNILKKLLENDTLFGWVFACLLIHERHDVRDEHINIAMNNGKPELSEMIKRILQNKTLERYN